MRILVYILLLFYPAMLASAGEEGSEDSAGVSYQKREYMIPMRDGTKLFTAVYSPRDISQEYPILLYRTPYSIRYYGNSHIPMDSMGPSKEFSREGYIFVYQDIRGTFRSEGEFVPIRAIRTDKSDSKATDESTDNFDTIDWLIKNIDGHNGRVGQWGISYMGWTTAMGMIDAHPALKASSPQASPADMFIGDDWHHNGAFRLMYSFDWLSRRGRERSGVTEQQPQPFDYEGTPWGYKFFLQAGPTSELNKKYFDGRVPAWQDFAEHPNYDEFWQQQSVTHHLEHINHSILNVAGWFDAEDFFGPLSIYNKVEKSNPGIENSLVIGPWRHTQWLRDNGRSLGDIDFGSNTTEWYKKHIVLPFFEYHLKGKGDWKPVEATVFETGSNRWRKFDKWPPRTASVKKLYLRVGGKLAFSPPPLDSTSIKDSYVDDPKKPVPFSTDIRTRQGHSWMIEDQRLVSTRPDVLVYQTDILEEDVTIAGPIGVNLFASTSGTDADFFVKLIDVFPGNTPDPESNPRGVKMGDYQMLLGAEVMRSKYRESFSHPKPMQPAKVSPIQFTIWDKFHTFKKGHRIMVHIHSSWFPAYDRNPNKFMNIYRAREGDYQKATQTIYRSSTAASHLELPVVPSH
ncbi:CocE/NonD family hydrolase [Pseudomaricurvus alkylphenolicus]|uniref:CocE/NonD family hydrolase n=1 Tax=Pseudomaricurvus alkylphenolicus TaxID=1306991 RepID=UPI001422F80B|nr:CocE/NonD family hydrolase [Pseudomaricurvus alkylphenolicus]NIB38458.1 CocE/NonD family hydrolase [Pseudomaricurvus alkylphenolicus]